jgi:hypothetical protein
LLKTQTNRLFVCPIPGKNVWMKALDREVVLKRSEFIEELVGIFTDRTVTVFAGAGVSIHSGIPLVHGDQGIMEMILIALGAPELDRRQFVNLEYLSNCSCSRSSRALIALISFRSLNLKLLLISMK